MQEVRCKKCGKMLGRIKGYYEIKCPRCKEINSQKPITFAEYLASDKAKEDLITRI
jgi:phage FluMu protein Com